MLVKMRRDATRDEVAAVEDKLHGLGFKTGKMVGEEITLVGVYGDISKLPVGEILDPGDVPLYEDAGIDCLQVGEPNSKNQALLNRLRTTPLPVIHKRGNSLDTEAYLLWVERIMTGGKENVILCERGITSANRYTRNTLDCGSIAAFRYQLSGLPIAVDASHGTGIRDLVHPATLAGVMAGASVVLVEAHPNPLIAKSDGFQGLFPEQLRALVRAAREAWRLRRELDRSYLASAAVEKEYLARMEADKARLFRSGHGHGPHEGPS